MTINLQTGSAAPVAATGAELLAIKTDLGLNLVSNTADANKPVSTPQATAIAAAIAAIPTSSGPSPTITSFAPATGPVGTVITLTGTGFTGSTAATLGATAAALAVTSATSATVTVPAGGATGLLSITNSRTTAVSATSFTVTVASSLVGVRLPTGKATVAACLPLLTAAAVASGAGGRVLIAAVGDSTTAGFFGDYINKAANCLPANMIPGLAGGAYYASANAVMGNSRSDVFGGPGLYVYDARVTSTGGWVWNAMSSLGGRTGQLLAGTTGTLSMAFATPFDTMEVYYMTNNAPGEFTVDIGGAVLATLATSQANAMRKQTIKVALGVHTVNFKRGGVDGNSYLQGVVAYDSTRKELAIVNASMCGGTISNTADGGTEWDCASTLLVMAPALTMISMQINDWQANNAVPAFKTATQYLITAAKAAGGDVMLWTGFPSATATTPIAQQQAFVTAYYELADTNGLLLVDVWQHEQPRVDANYFDGTHPKLALYQSTGLNLGKVVAAGINGTA